MIYKLLFTGLARKCLSPLVLPVCLYTPRIMRASHPADTNSNGSIHSRDRY